MLMVFLAAPDALKAQVSLFTAGDEGWRVVSFGNWSINDYSIVASYTPTFSATGGNPGGYISQSDPDGGDFTFSAPASYLGNQIAAFGSTLSYDISYVGTQNYYTTDVMLVGGGLRLLWQASPTLTPTSSWTTVTAALTPSAQWHVGSTLGALASTSDFNTVLGNLTGIYIRGEFAFGSDLTGLDNVRFGAVPEPSVIALMGAGVALIGAAARRRPR